MSAWPELGALTRLRIWLYLWAVPIHGKLRLYFCLQDAVLAEHPAGWLRLARMMAYNAVLFEGQGLAYLSISWLAFYYVLLLVHVRPRLLA